MWFKERWHRQLYGMGCRASEAIMAKKTRDQYVAEMLAMRPRLKVAVWQPRLEGVYDNTMECFNKSRGPCGKCGKETNGHTSHMSMGKFAYCIGCEPPGSDFGRKDAA